MFQRITYSMFVFSFLFWLGCPSQQIKKDPILVDNDQEAKSIQKARTYQKQNKKEEEKQAWLSLEKQFPSSKYLVEAHLRLGILYYQNQEWELSRKYLETSLASSLSESQRVEGSYYYGKLLFELKEFQKASKSFRQIYPQLNATQKKEVLSLLEKSAQRTGHNGTLLSLKIKKWEISSGEKKEQLKTEIQETLQGSFGLEDLKNLSSLSQGKTGFPYDWISLRLAKQYLHEANPSKSKEVLHALLPSVSLSHPLYRHTRALQKQLKKRTAAASPKTIGVLLPLTGRASFLAKIVKSGIDLAKKDFPGVRWIFKDTKSNPTSTRKAVRSLVFRHKVMAIFGPILPDNAVAAALEAESLQVPLLSISLAEDLPNLGKFVFRNNLTRSQMGKTMAAFAIQKMKLKRFAILYPNNAYGKLQVSAFWKEVENLGGKVVAVESFAPNSINFTTAAQKLVGRHDLNKRPLWSKLTRSLREVKSAILRKRLYKNLKQQFPPITHFDAIFIPENWTTVYKIVPALVQQDIEVKPNYRHWENQTIKRYNQRKKHLKFIQLLGTNGWNNEKIFLVESKDIVGSVFNSRYFANSSKTLVKTFVRDYQRNYPEYTSERKYPPSDLAAYAYDSIRILGSIAQKNNLTDRNAFQKALLQIKDFPGVTGEMTTMENGEILAPVQFLLAHRKKEFRLFGSSR